MAIGIRILSNNLSGLTTNVTFLPLTGGTISLGQQVFPFNYISDYVYGTYNCFVPTYGYTYTLVVPGLTPTPTTTVTPTVTPTPTVTETPTNTPTLTNTQTPTSTLTPTNTETPTNTPSPTNTETPTNTPTITQTQTPTTTPTTTPTPTSNRYGFSVSSGVTFNDACSQLIPSITIYGEYAIFDENITFYDTIVGPNIGVLNGYFNNNQTVVNLVNNVETGGFSLCPSITPTSTPTPTLTPSTTINYYYSTNPVCVSPDSFENVVLDNDFCDSTTITSSTVLPDGSYTIGDGSVRRNIIASGGLYSFTDGCVACA